MEIVDFMVNHFYPFLGSSDHLGSIFFTTSPKYPLSTGSDSILITLISTSNEGPIFSPPMQSIGWAIVRSMSVRLSVRLSAAVCTVG